MESLKITQKILDMMIYSYDIMHQYPKSEKFTLCADIKKNMDILLERSIEVQKKYYKKNTLQDMDVANLKLKAYIRLSYQLKFIPAKTYEVWAGHLVEIGKMIGGWQSVLAAKNKGNKS